MILVEVEVDGEPFEEIYCLPKQLMLRLPSTKERKLWIPVERARSEGVEPLIDWSLYTGARGLSLIKEVPVELGSHTKEEWLDQPIAVGPSFLPNETLAAIAAEAGIHIGFDHQITVRDLIALPLSTIYRRIKKTHGRRLHATQAWLREVGFNYEDGPFLQGGTKRRLVEDVMQTCDTNHQQATLIVDSARQMGWAEASWEWEE